MEYNMQDLPKIKHSKQAENGRKYLEDVIDWIN